jgi:hypothetical protein
MCEKHSCIENECSCTSALFETCECCENNECDCKDCIVCANEDTEDGE